MEISCIARTTYEVTRLSPPQISRLRKIPMDIRIIWNMRVDSRPILSARS